MDLFRRFFQQSKSDTQPPAAQPPKVAPAGGPTAEEIAALAKQPPTKKSGDTAPLPSEPLGAQVDGATRQLPPETVISSSNQHVTFGQATDVGMVRRNNEDASFCFFCTSRTAEERPDFGVFIVADGMGGHRDGEKASAIATRIVASHMVNSVYMHMLSGGDTADFPPISETLEEGVQKANAEIRNEIQGGGTTLTAVTVVGDLAYIAHVGDSRVYLITKDGLEQITRDHSTAERLKELGLIKPGESAARPNELYRALGSREALEVDTRTRRLPPNSRLLLCSDGLWNLLEEHEIIACVMRPEDPQKACEQLISLANAHGGTDNITAILLRIPSN